MTTDELRNGIKALELEAEKIELGLLEDLAVALPARAGSAAAVRRNLAAAMGIFAVGDELDEGRMQLETIANAIAGG